MKTLAFNTYRYRIGVPKSPDFVEVIYDTETRQIQLHYVQELLIDKNILNELDLPLPEDGGSILKLMGDREDMEKKIKEVRELIFESLTHLRNKK